MITSMNHITLGVKNIDKSFAFYHDVLELKPLVKWDKGAYFFVSETNPNLLGSRFWFCLSVDEKQIPNPCYTHYAFTVPEKNFDSMIKKIIGISGNMGVLVEQLSHMHALQQNLNSTLLCRGDFDDIPSKMAY
ncbi:MAG: VOC family protein [Gammaproteobacteria bacterium]|nr:VOC family protein [Gammaproteobacteria bacterium]MCW5583345.1 VOC family protein [Gammaproteobacteria bacterium]